MSTLRKTAVIAGLLGGLVAAFSFLASYFFYLTTPESLRGDKFSIVAALFFVGFPAGIAILSALSIRNNPSPGSIMLIMIGILGVTPWFIELLALNLRLGTTFFGLASIISLLIGTFLMETGGVLAAISGTR